MDEDQQSVVKGIKEPKKRRIISSTSHAGLSNCSAEYVHSRSSTSRRTATLDTNMGKLQKALQFKNENIIEKSPRSYFPVQKARANW